MEVPYVFVYVHIYIYVLYIYMHIFICMYMCICIYGHALRAPPTPPQMVWEAPSVGCGGVDVVWGLVGGNSPSLLLTWGVVGGNPPSSSPPCGVGSCGWEGIPSFPPCGVGSGEWDLHCSVGFGGVEFVLGSLGGLVGVVKLL